MELIFDAVYYEKQVLEYSLGKSLLEKYQNLPQFEIQSHNRIPEFSSAENKDFPKLKQHLILGVRKTHKYVENHKVSDWLVPYTSSGCRAMCLYCYLVCNYNKCSYLRVFVNREQMMQKILKTDATSFTPQTFEIGSNSDLVLENCVTGNLPWTIEYFGKYGRGKLTFPTKFDMVGPLLNLNHQGKTIFRMSVNPNEIIQKIEIGTSVLRKRIHALNSMAEAGYPVGILIAPVILIENWKPLYKELIEILASELSPTILKNGFIEIILMTYSFVQNAINTEAFPLAEQLLDKDLMTGRGRGKYCYQNNIRLEVETFLRGEIEQKLKMPILYIA